MTGDRIFKKRYGGLCLKNDSLSAMPTDVRKRSALPSNFNDEFGAAPQLGIAQNRDAHLPEGQRPSAIQSAEPPTVGQGRLLAHAVP